MPSWQLWLQQAKKNQQLPILLTLLFILCLAYSIWQLTQVIQIPSVAPLVPPTQATTPPPDIASQHLLGRFSQQQATLPVTKLQLTLTGTIFLIGDAKNSRAIITSPGLPSKVYKVGDLLPGNVKLSQIHATYVVIDDNGQLEKLVLPIKKLHLEE